MSVVLTGAHLERMEGSVAFRSIARRLTNLKLASDGLSYKPPLGIRSLKSLPVRVG